MGLIDSFICREDADAEFLNTVAAAIGDASPGTLTFLTGGCASPSGRHHKSVEKVFLLSGPKGEACIGFVRASSFVQCCMHVMQALGATCAYCACNEQQIVQGKQNISDEASCTVLQCSQQD